MDAQREEMGDESRLRIQSLTLHDFRNYANFHLEPSDSITIFVGNNAVGKTNIIEALQLLTSGESFRKPTWSDVVMWGKNRSSISLTAENKQNRSIDLQMRIEGNLRSYFLNGKQKRRISEIKGIIPCVLFTPEDLQLIKDSAEKRRATLDSLGGQIAPAYELIKNDYEKVLKHRNTLLKLPSTSQSLLEPWSEKLVEIGTAFYHHRRKLFERLVPCIEETYHILSPKENLEVIYQPSWGETQLDPAVAFRDSLDRALLQEQARGVTLVGPQRDEIIFMIDGKNARHFGSQGQQRSVALAWKLAEIEVITQILGTSPILLLDDVMSELDSDRREALTRFIGGSIQTFITTTTTGYFDEGLLEGAKIVRFSKEISDTSGNKADEGEGNGHE